MEPGTSPNLQGSGPIRGRRQLGQPAGTHRQSHHKEETREYHMQRLNHKAPPALVAFAVAKAQRGASAPPPHLPTVLPCGARQSFRITDVSSEPSEVQIGRALARKSFATLFFSSQIEKSKYKRPSA